MRIVSFVCMRIANDGRTINGRNEEAINEYDRKLTYKAIDSSFMLL